MSISINEFASRPVHTTSVIRISLLSLGVIASLAIGKALLAQGLTTPAMAEPAVAKIAAEPVAASARASKKTMCRMVEVEVEDGAGVSGRGIVVCGKAR